MQQEPAECVEVLATLGRIERQREIATALSDAVIAQTFAGPQILAPRLIAQLLIAQPLIAQPIAAQLGNHGATSCDGECGSACGAFCGPSCVARDLSS